MRWVRQEKILTDLKKIDCKERRTTSHMSLESFVPLYESHNIYVKCKQGITTCTTLQMSL